MRVLSSFSQLCNVDRFSPRRGVTRWMVNWERNGWRTAAGKPVKNQDLWVRLDEQVQQHHVTWEWVKGHTGHEGNEMADQLANRAIDEM